MPLSGLIVRSLLDPSPLMIPRSSHCHERPDFAINGIPRFSTIPRRRNVRMKVFTDTPDDEPDLFIKTDVVAHPP